MSIYADAERFAAQYGTHDPFELLDAMNVVVTFSDRFASDGLKGFCTIMNKTRYVSGWHVPASVSGSCGILL